MGKSVKVSSAVLSSVVGLGMVVAGTPVTAIAEQANTTAPVNGNNVKVTKAASNDLDSLKKAMDKAADEQVAAKKDVEKAEDAVKTAQENVDKAQAKFDEAQKAVDEAQKALDTAKTNQADGEKALADAIAKRDAAKDAWNKASAAYDQAEKDQQAASEKVAAAKANLEAVKNQNDLATLTKAKNVADKKANHFANQLAKAEAALANAKAESKRLHLAAGKTKHDAEQKAAQHIHW